MSIESTAAIIFLIILTLFLIKNKKRLEIQKIFWPVLYFTMYKTKLGLKQMDSLAKKYPKILDNLSKFGVFIGILGIGIITFLLAKNIYDLMFIPSAVSGAALVLPFKVKGVFYVPFFYWIISIFVIATVHEFSHGVISRLHDIPIKSSGFAFLNLIIPVIPAAFVEPDEKILGKKERMKKLSVFAAGPFSNILSGAVFLILFLLLSVPIAGHVIEFNGIKVEGYTNVSAAKLAGVPTGIVITELDGLKILTLENLSTALGKNKVGDKVNVITTNGTFNVQLGSNPDNSSIPYLGLLLSQSQKTKASFEERYGVYTAPVIMWFMGLLYFLFTLSLGIGLFNLIPVGPVDGGLMSKEICKFFFKEERAKKIWVFISIFVLVVIVINLFAGFIF